MVLDQSAEVCHKLLLHNDILLDYLKSKRNLTDKTISLHKLGAFPKDIRIFSKHNISLKKLRLKKVICNASFSNFKHHQLIIPIKDFMGNVIALGGRCILSESKRKFYKLPKYINSGYKKGAHLFGLNIAKHRIRELDKVYVVEGYFDVITAHQNGFRNVVATSGTTFSYRQLIILSRYTDNICILFDNDPAGQKSCNQIKDKLKDSEANIEYKFTPKGYKDLDEFLQKGGDFNYIK